MKKIIALFVVASLAFVLLAGCGTSKAEQQRINSLNLRACQDNLRTIDSATMQYAAANVGVCPSTVSQLVPMYMREAPTCPLDGRAYTLSAGTPPRATCPNGHTY